MFCDLKAAFPSLSRQFLFWVIEEMKFPPEVKRFLRKLHADCTAEMVVYGEVLPGFALTWQWLAGFCSNNCQLRAALLVLTAATFMELQVKKTVIVPWWQCNLEEGRAKVESKIDAFGGIKVASEAKFSAILSGPGAPIMHWKAEGEKLVRRAKLLKSLHEPLAETLRGYSSIGFSVMRHIMQFQPVTDLACKMEYKAVQSVKRSPWNSLPCHLLMQLRQLGWRNQCQSLRAANIAAMARLAISNDACWKVIEIMDASDPDDLERTVVPLYEDSFVNISARHLANAYSLVHSLSTRIGMVEHDHLQAHLTELVVGTLGLQPVATTIEARARKMKIFMQSSATWFTTYVAMRKFGSGVQAALLKAVMNAWPSHRHFLERHYRVHFASGRKAKKRCT